MASPLVAWTILIVSFVLPLLHVGFSKAIGPAKPVVESTSCPFSPRMGWLVIVLFLGPIGWFMFMTSRNRRRRMAAEAPPPPANTEN